MAAAKIAAPAESVGLGAASAGAPARIAAARKTATRKAATRKAATRKALEPWLALGIDLAAIELLALVLVADDLVGRIQLGKARRGSRIVLVGIGVMLLGELAIGALDRRSAGAPRHPQDLIGVAHPSHLLQGTYILDSGLPARFDFIWGLRGIFATGLLRMIRRSVRGLTKRSCAPSIVYSAIAGQTKSFVRENRIPHFLI